MTKKLTPSHIAVAVAAGLTAQTAFAQTPPVEQSSNGSGQEGTPMIKLDNNQYSGQGFFEKPSGKKSAAAPAAPKAEEKPLKQVSATDSAPSAATAPVPVSSAPAANKVPIKDPMLPLNIVGSKDAKENTNGGLTPLLAKKESAPVAATASAGLKKPESLLSPMPEAPPAASVAGTPSSGKIAGNKSSDKMVKTSAPTAKKKSVAKKAAAKRAPVVEAPYNLTAKEVVPVEVQEMPERVTADIAPALYAAEPTTPIIVTEVVRIDSISLQAPTIAEQETKPLPRLPEPAPVVAAIVPAPLPERLPEPVIPRVPTAQTPSVAENTLLPPMAPAVEPSAPMPPVFQPAVVAAVAEPVAPQPVFVPAPIARPRGETVPMASASMADLPAMDAPSVETIRNTSRLHPRSQAVPVAVVPAPAVAPVRAPVPVYTPKEQSAPAPVVIAAAPVQSSPSENRDARIQALLDELKMLQSNPMVVESVQPPMEVIAPHRVHVPKIDPAATIQLPLPEAPRPLIKPTPREPARMVTERAPKAPVDVPQTAAIDAPRTMTPAPVLEPRTHRVANPKFAGLPEKGDFIAFMPGSSHVSEETVESLRSMVDVFKQHGIRKIVLTGTALRDEDSEDMESSDFAQKRAKNLKAAFQRAGFKGVIALDDPKRARPGTTPRVGLVALQ